MKFNVNDKVLIASDDLHISSFKCKVATVKKIYTEVNPPVAFVEVEDPATGDTVGFKVALADLVAIEYKPEGAREITKSDFDAALDDVTRPDKMLSNVKVDPYKRFLATMVAIKVGCKAEREIFSDSDSVVMTEDQFVDALWNVCSPTALVEKVDGKMSAYACMDVAFAAIAILKDIVPILFGESKK